MYALDLNTIDIKIHIVKNYSNIYVNYLLRLSVVLIIASFLFLFTACQDAQVTGEYDNPYTTDEVKTMLSYHGALVAKFDGRQWYFLSGDRWIKLENAGAYKYALLFSKHRSSKF
ncbi:MAG: hypothetical protein JRI40_10770 [Deltaproteobacteria bacterium]|nr:hypothetical protein [Deltaproteobacteria bacterium]